MSFKLAGRAWEVGEVSVSQKLVLLALADTASDDGQCWPGRKCLAKKCGMTLRTLDNNLDSLIERGLLKKTLRKRKNGSYRSSLYQIFPPQDEEPKKDQEENSGEGGSEEITPPSLAKKLPEGGAKITPPSEKNTPLESTTYPVFDFGLKNTTTTGSGGNQDQTPTLGNEVEEYIFLVGHYGRPGDKKPDSPAAYRTKARRRIMKEQGGQLSEWDREQLCRWRKLWARKQAAAREDAAENAPAGREATEKNRKEVQERDRPGMNQLRAQIF